MKIIIDLSKKLISLLTIFFSILFFSDCRSEVLPEKEPKLSEFSTLQEKIAFLNYIKIHYIPHLLDEAATYEKDLFQLLDDQSKMTQKLKLEPRKDLLHFNISEKKSVSFKSKVINGDRLKQFISSLKEMVGTDKSKLKEYLQKEIKELLSKSSLQFNPETIAPLLAKSLGIDPKKFLQMSVNEKIDLLNKMVEEPLDKGLKEISFKQLNYNNIPTKKQFLEDFKNKSINFEKLKKLLSLSLFYSNHYDNQVDQLFSNQTIDESHLDLLKDNEHIKKGLEVLCESGDINCLQELKKINPIKLVKGIYNDLTSETTVITEEEVGKITVHEVPPNIGVFRGFAGGDCSSSNSSMYANSPKERVFFIYNSNGENLGYVAGTNVMVDQKPAFYLHTIAGKRIGGKIVNMILDSFSKQSGLIDGATTICVPPAQKRYEMINYQVIRETLFSLTKGLDTPKGMTYFPSDKEIRHEFIDKTSLSDYDKVESNKECLPYSNKYSILTLNIEPIQSDLHLLFNLKKYELTLQDQLLLAIDLYSINRKKSSEEIFKVNNKDSSWLKEFFDLLDNKNQLSEKEYINDLKIKLGTLNLSFDELYFKRPFLIENGLLKANDSFSEDKIERNLKILTKWFTENDDNKRMKFFNEWKLKKKTSEDEINIKNLVESSHFEHFTRKICSTFKPPIGIDVLKKEDVFGPLFDLILSKNSKLQTLCLNHTKKISCTPLIHDYFKFYDINEGFLLDSLIKRNHCSDLSEFIKTLLPKVIASLSQQKIKEDSQEKRFLDSISYFIFADIKNNLKLVDPITNQNYIDIISFLQKLRNPIIDNQMVRYLLDEIYNCPDTIRNQSLDYLEDLLKNSNDSEILIEIMKNGSAFYDRERTKFWPQYLLSNIFSKRNSDNLENSLINTLPTIFTEGSKWLESPMKGKWLKKILDNLNENEFLSFLNYHDPKYYYPWKKSFLQLEVAKLCLEQIREGKVLNNSYYKPLFDFVLMSRDENLLKELKETPSIQFNEFFKSLLLNAKNLDKDNIELFLRANKIDYFNDLILSKLLSDKNWQSSPYFFRLMDHFIMKSDKKIDKLLNEKFFSLTGNNFYLKKNFVLKYYQLIFKTKKSNLNVKMIRDGYRKLKDPAILLKIQSTIEYADQHDLMETISKDLELTECSDRDPNKGLPMDLNVIKAILEYNSSIYGKRVKE